MDIIVLLGPTASGKTALAIDLAKILGCEIVSADSIQIYRGLDIGSAKPSAKEMRGVRHHLLDVADVTDASFSVARYRALADAAIADIAARGNTPLIVGGTGLYVNALTYPLRFIAPPDTALRAALLEEERQAPGCLYARLRAVDPRRAEQLHPNDMKRIVRALEVHALTGRAHSSFGDDFQNEAGESPPYNAVMLGLTMEREALYARINARVDGMMAAGLLEEARRLTELPPSLPALQGLGYKQLLAYLRGETPYEDAIARIKMETRRYAKRQWTWFRRDNRICWFDVAKNNVLDDMLRYLAGKGFHARPK